MSDWVQFDSRYERDTGHSNHPGLMKVNPDEVIAVVKKEKQDFVTLELSNGKSLIVFGNSYDQVLKDLGK